ncbi:hypothetical protein FS837_005756 [Tulasnella sp. UAMH 9824]|nr:hypothetical protein FS837_005756 [Tulasnella sp. UAMH 9824]
MQVLATFWAAAHADIMACQEILNLIRDADWMRFRRHAIRVSSIEFNEEAAESFPSAHGIAFLCLHHRFGTTFTPNVRRIQWTVSSKTGALLMMPFISERLEDLQLDLQTWARETEELFLSLVHRTLTLKTLSVKSWNPPSNIADSFCRWIQTCFELEKAHLPRDWHTLAIINAFGCLPKLVEFGLEWTDRTYDDVDVKLPILVKEKDFPGLRRLGWSSNISRAKEFLQLTTLRLQGLTFDCWEQSDERELTEFLATTVQCCPELDSLCLSLGPITEAVDPEGENIPLSWKIFRPLLECRTLVELRIHHPSSCILSISDLEDMGAAWPKITELYLCPDPDIYPKYRGTPISSLAHAAAAFPQLRALGLYIDHLGPPKSAGDLFPECQFRRLRELDVGTSRVPNDDPIPVGLYLASLFAVGTRPSIRTGPSIVRVNDISDEDDDAWADDWRTAQRLAHLTLQTKEAISEVALDELWRDLEDIYPLLKLLIPFDSFYDEYRQDKFEHEETLYFLRDADWPRFRQYAARVKSIAYHEIAVNVSPPSKEGIALICLYLPYGNCLTPNVRKWWTLSYSATITPMMPFMSQCLEELKLKISLEATETEDLFLGLTHRTPNLKRLFIESEASPGDISSSLSRWIWTCLSLEKAHIPRRWQTSTIVTAFGSLPNLLKFGIHWNHSPLESTSVGKDMEVVEGHFQNLQRLGWFSDIKGAANLQQTTCFVESIEPDEGLELLELPVEMFRPLLSCSRLRQLRIHYPGPCILSTSDVEDMGAAWPNMEELVLCPDPDGSDQGTPISWLPCVAIAFPRIRLLGLHFDHLNPPGSAGDLLSEI